MDIIAETLRWVNGERVARDIGPPLDRLPKGQPRNCYRCPVANALGNPETTSVAIVWWAGPRENVAFPPDAVAAFIDAFDQGDHTEYAL